MKATELRIGNYVIEKGKIKPMYSISNHNAKDYSRIKPIPLTEEWFVKFGFESDGIEWWNGILSIGICKEGLRYLPTEQINVRVGIVLQYVHQLQNLYFALTNEELTNEEIILAK